MGRYNVLVARQRSWLLSAVLGVVVLLLVAKTYKGPTIFVTEYGGSSDTLADECSHFANDYTKAFQSSMTKGLNWRFYCAAVKAGTDKVTAHSYQAAYAKHLGNNWLEPIKILEIGLGCRMSYGPGKSLQMWRLLFPNSKISYLEYNFECAAKFKTDIERATRGTLYPGRQENETLLAEIVADAKSSELYDVIVDDGGHDPVAQLKSLQGLWPALKSGGIYVVEDLQTNYLNTTSLAAFGLPTEYAEESFMSWASRMSHMVHCQAAQRNFYTDERRSICYNRSALEKEILSIDFSSEACVIVKHAVV